MKIRRLKLKALRTGNAVEIYGEKKRNDGATFTSAWLGTLDLPDFVEFITHHYEDLRLNGCVPGIPDATLAERFAFEEKSKGGE